MIERRRYMGLTALPYDYEVEYLESSGTQLMYGTQPVSEIDYIEYHFDNIKAQSNGFVGVNGVTQIGVYDSRYNTMDIGFYKLVGIKGTDNKWTIYNITKGTFYYNNYSGLQYSENGLFNMTGGYKASIRLYEYLSKSEGVLTEHFIPVVKDNVGYMYDKVSGQLFGNTGTGEFIVGPRVTGGGKHLVIRMLPTFTERRWAA